jgi:hypothetical protein
MLVLGAATNPWEMLSSLQPTSASAAAAGIGVDPFVADGAPPPPATHGSQSPAPAPGAFGGPSLSPDVLGFLIWNQSQQPGSAPAAGGATNAAATNGADASTTEAAGGTDPSGVTAWSSLPSWFAPPSPDTAGNALGPNNSVGNGGAASAATAASQSNTNADPILAAGQPDGAPQGSSPHGHHHHHAGFAPAKQSNQSDPFANLFGTPAQDGSSTTATNADGSTTTTITYADGSELTLTTPAQVSNATATPSTPAAQPPINSNNFLEALIQLQARLLAPTAAA